MAGNGHVQAPTPTEGWHWQAGNGWTWDHHPIADQRARAVLANDPGLPAFARALLTGSDETPHVEARPEAVAGVAPDFPRGEPADPKSLSALRFVVLPDRLVTARRAPLDCTYEAYCAARDGTPPSSPAAMLDDIITRFAAAVVQQADALSRELDAVEDGLLAPEPRGDRTRLGQVRRQATHLQRAIVPLARMMSRDATLLPAWFTEAAVDAGATARRRVLTALDDLSALQSRARAIQDELSSLQTEETNRRLYVLSIVTTVLLPPTLVAGFFGMNTGGLPFEKPEWGTLGAAAVLGGAIALALLLLRRLRLV